MKNIIILMSIVTFIFIIILIIQNLLEKRRLEIYKNNLLQDKDEEVKKNALIALYNLVGREVLDEVANGQNFSDNLKMEAVSMISEYEDDEDE